MKCSAAVDAGADSSASSTWASRPTSSLAVAHEAVRRGVVMFPTGRGFLKFTPPLCIEPAAVLEAADVIRECLVDLRDQAG